MKNDVGRLKDILESIHHIQKYDSEKRNFEKDELIQNWMVRHIQIIGEASYKLSKELRDKHPEIPFTKIIGMRHVLVHDYFDIDLDIAWSVVENEIPTLKKKIETLLRDLED